MNLDELIQLLQFIRDHNSKIDLVVVNNDSNDRAYYLDSDCFTVMNNVLYIDV